ncbi:MAG: hypothetical protein C0618_09365 [Desulfuromonas sp.]|nr:MAG: hypothetical protein C0618_09365 [Desulfuromonas sp.]
MKHLFWLFTFLLLCSSAAATEVSRIAAIVNHEIITTLQLDKAVAQQRQGINDEEISDEALQRLRNQILEQKIEELLHKQRTRELGLQVRDDELESAITDIQNQNGLNRQELIQALQAQGMDFDTYRENLKTEILRYKLIGREVGAKVEVSSREIRDYLQDHIEEYRQEPTIHIRRISVDIPASATAGQRTALDDLMEEIRLQLTEQQKDFAVVLASLGDTASGDDMGNLTIAELLPSIQDAVRDLDVGGVSAPVALGNQLHLFQLAGRNDDDDALFERVKDDIEEKLRKTKTDERFIEWAQELRKNARVKVLL